MQVLAATGNKEIDVMIIKMTNSPLKPIAYREGAALVAKRKQPDLAFVSPLLGGSMPFEQLLYELRKVGMRVVVLIGNTKPDEIRKKWLPLGVYDYVTDPVTGEKIRYTIAHPATLGMAEEKIRRIEKGEMEEEISVQSEEPPVLESKSAESVEAPFENGFSHLHMDDQDPYIFENSDELITPPKKKEETLNPVIESKEDLKSKNDYKVERDQLKVQKEKHKAGQKQSEQIQRLINGLESAFSFFRLGQSARKEDNQENNEAKASKNERFGFFKKQKDTTKKKQLQSNEVLLEQQPIGTMSPEYFKTLDEIFNAKRKAR